MTWGLLHTHKKLYLHQIQSVKKKQLQNCTVRQLKKKWINLLKPSIKVYILIPSELGKTFYTIDCKNFKYLVKNICILQLFFNGLFYA